MAFNIESRDGLLYCRRRSLSALLVFDVHGIFNMPEILLPMMPLSVEDHVCMSDVGQASTLS
jgi:hypothetical protein